MAFEKEIEKLNKKLTDLEKPELVEKQHQRGKLTAKKELVCFWIREALLS